MGSIDIDPREGASLLEGQLPRRFARLLRHGRYLAENWDVNLLSRMDDEARFLATAMATSTELADALRALCDTTADLLDPPHSPGSASRERLSGCLKALEHLVPAQPQAMAATGKNDTKAGDSAFADLDLPMSPEQWREFVYGSSRSARAPAATAQPVPVAAQASPAPAVVAAAPPVAAPLDTATQDDAGADLANLLRTALDTGTLSLWFQPIVAMQGESTARFQALLRLHGKNGHVHTAAEILPSAERAGLLGAVDRWMLEHCIALIAQRARAGHAIRLYVPQSLNSARNGWAATRVARLLGEQQVAARAMSLELHVADVVAAPGDVARYAESVRALGCGFVLSDFEAGQESLLHGMTVDAVRLSARHLRLGEAQARADLKALVEYLHEQGVRVIAPRVDGADVAAALFGAGVDYVQGNFVQPVNDGFDFDFREALA